MTLCTSFMFKAQLPDVSGESSKSSDGSSPAVLISSLTLSTYRAPSTCRYEEVPQTILDIWKRPRDHGVSWINEVISDKKRKGERERKKLITSLSATRSLL